MRAKTSEQISEVLKLTKEGVPKTEISKRLGISYATVMRIVRKDREGLPQSKKDNTVDLIIDDLQNPSKEDKEIYRNYVYMLGVYLGDGCIARLKKKPTIFTFSI